MMLSDIIALKLEIDKEILSLTNSENNTFNGKTNMILKELDVHRNQLKDLGDALSHLEKDIFLYSTDASHATYSAQFHHLQNKVNQTRNAIRQQLMTETQRLKMIGTLEMARLKLLNLPNIKIDSNLNADSLDFTSRELRQLPSNVIKYLFNWQTLSQYIKELQAAQNQSALSLTITKGLKYFEKFHQSEIILQRLVRGGENEVDVSLETIENVGKESNTLNRAVETVFAADQCFGADSKNENELEEIDELDGMDDDEIDTSKFVRFSLGDTKEVTELDMSGFDDDNSLECGTPQQQTATPNPTQAPKNAMLDEEVESWDEEFAEELDDIRRRFNNRNGKGSVRCLRALVNQDTSIQKDLIAMGVDFFTAPSAISAEAPVESQGPSVSTEADTTQVSDSNTLLMLSAPGTNVAARRRSISSNKTEVCSSAPNTPKNSQAINNDPKLKIPALCASMSHPVERLKVVVRVQ